MPTETWTISGTSRLSDVRLSSTFFLPGTSYHYVFTIPSEAMRRNATKFGHFDVNLLGRQYKLAFEFFLSFCQMSVRTPKKLTPGDKSLAFIEWCDTGWRVHLFVQREISETEVMKALLQEHAKKAEKLEVRNKPVPAVLEISTYEAYANDVYNKYTRKECMVDELYSELVGSDCFPSGAFSLDDASYRDEMQRFKFPCIERVIRVSPLELNDWMKNKMLPDFMMYRIAKREIRLTPEGDGYRMQVLQHRDDMQPEQPDEVFTAEQIAEIDCIKVFPGETTSCGNLGDIENTQVQYIDEPWIFHSSLEDLTGDARELYETMKQRQYSIHAIDWIKLMSLEQPEETRKQFIMDEFYTRVWDDPDCDASAPLKSLVQWAHKVYNPAMMSVYRLPHRNLSVMANRAARVMHGFEHLYQISAAHKYVYTVLLARLDAFRHEHNLHLNLIATGEAATSKSFTFELLEVNSIAGTISWRTYDTGRSDAFDGDRNNECTVFDELPRIYYNDVNNKGPIEALKSKLTSMCTKARYLFCDPEDGKRKQLTTLSQNIGVVIGGSNDPRHYFDEPLTTRFQWFDSVKTNISGRRVSDCMHAMSTMSGYHVRRGSELQHYFKFEQLFVGLAWIFHYLGVIKINTIALDVVMLRFKAYMEQHGVVVPTRTQKRIKLLAKNLALVRGKEIMYHTETGEYAQTPFEPEHILTGEKYYVVTKEIAMHAIGLLFENIVSRNEYRCLRQLWTYHEASLTWGMDDRGQNDYNYVLVNTPMKELGNRLAQSISASGHFVSSCNIMTILKKLQSKTVNCGQYTCVDGVVGESGARTEAAAVIVDTKQVKFHYHLFKDFRDHGVEPNLYKDAMQHMAHAYCREETIMLGMNDHGVNTPHTFGLMQFEPSSEVMTFTEGIGEQEDTYGILGETSNCERKLEEDLDEYAQKQHAEDIGEDFDFYKPMDIDFGENAPYPPRKRRR